jgi:hypothetical protein
MVLLFTIIGVGSKTLHKTGRHGALSGPSALLKGPHLTFI